MLSIKLLLWINPTFFFCFNFTFYVTDHKVLWYSHSSHVAVFLDIYLMSQMSLRNPNTWPNCFCTILHCVFIFFVLCFKNTPTFFHPDELDDVNWYHHETWNIELPTKNDLWTKMIFLQMIAFHLMDDTWIDLDE